MSTIQMSTARIDKQVESTSLAVYENHEVVITELKQSNFHYESLLTNKSVLRKTRKHVDCWLKSTYLKV